HVCPRPAADGGRGERVGRWAASVDAFVFDLGPVGLEIEVGAVVVVVADHAAGENGAVGLAFFVTFVGADFELHGRAERGDLGRRGFLRAPLRRRGALGRRCLPGARFGVDVVFAWAVAVFAAVLLEQGRGLVAHVAGLVREVLL